MSSSELNAMIAAAAVNVTSDASALEVRLDAARFPRIADVDGAMARRTIEGFIREAALADGRNIGDEAIRIHAGILYDKVSGDFPRITLTEIGRAIHKGVFGELGDSFGFTATTFYKWVASYVESEEIQEALRREQQAYDNRARRDVQEVSEFLERFSDYAKAIAHKD